MYVCNKLASLHAMMQSLILSSARKSFLQRVGRSYGRKVGWLIGQLSVGKFLVSRARQNFSVPTGKLFLDVPTKYRYKS